MPLLTSQRDEVFATFFSRCSPTSSSNAVFYVDLLLSAQPICCERKEKISWLSARMHRDDGLQDTLLQPLFRRAIRIPRLKTK